MEKTVLSFNEVWARQERRIGLVLTKQMRTELKGPKIKLIIGCEAVVQETKT